MAKRLQVYETSSITITFDPNVWRHTGICLCGRRGGRRPTPLPRREGRGGTDGRGERSSLSSLRARRKRRFVDRSWSKLDP